MKNIKQNINNVLEKLIKEADALDNPRTWKEKCDNQALAQDKYQEINALCDALLNDSPMNVKAFTSKAMALVKLYKYPGAVANAMAALLLDPDNIDALYYQSYASSMMYPGNLLQAMNNINKILKLDPDNIDALNHLVHIHVGNRDNDEAEKVAKEILKKYPNNLEALHSMGEAKSYLAHQDMLEAGEGITRGHKKYKELLKITNRALKIDPTLMWAWLLKADALYGLEKYQESFDAANEMLKIYPGHSLGLLKKEEAQHYLDQ